jgi:catechol 2,3-dioxygenase-like lactoylglutathione lyase family enzyme
MSTTATRPDQAATRAGAGTAALKLEVITIPVSDVERAKAFYESLGWRLDADFSDGRDRAIQFTPPGSPCSIHFGTRVTPAAPGSAQGLWLIVSDIHAAREELVRRGVEASEVFHSATLNRLDPHGRLSGPDPDRRSYASFVSFNDPDGNGWVLQEITTRLPGRIDAAATSYGSTSDLADAMRRAETAHGEHEKRLGQRDADWPTWYATYMAAEQAGTELPT